VTKYSLLLPQRHEPDLFVCDVVDAVLKSDIDSMAHPVFTLSTAPNMKSVVYERGDRYLKESPSPYGRATVHERDVLIYCISQCMDALNRGQQISRHMRLRASELLIATNRQTSGRGYELLKNAFRRLQGTQIETNIRRDGKERFKVFGLIEETEIVRETKDGRMIEVDITLSDWIFDAIEQEHVLTLSRRYFRLRGPLERRLYELARKHCGQQRSWQIGLEALRAKCGSESQLWEFRRQLKKIIAADVKEDYLPEYRFELRTRELVVVHRKEAAEAAVAPMDASPLNMATYAEGRSLAPGWDIYVVEREWRTWVRQKKIAVKHPDRHFLSFCRARGLHPG
jgi:plasmid replication initiation protein